jgi:hypothetical protein
MDFKIARTWNELYGEKEGEERQTGSGLYNSDGTNGKDGNSRA